MPWNKLTYQRFFPRLTWQVKPQIPRILEEAAPDAVILDLGAGGRKLDHRTVCVDFILLDGTNVVGNVEILPFRSNSVDVVFGTGLLEHVEDDRKVLIEVARVLKPGGVAHMEAPFMQQYHDDPIDNRRYTVPGIAREMNRVGLETVRNGAHIGPTVCIITLFTYYVAMWFEADNVACKAISTGVFLTSSLVLWPAKFLDKLIIGRNSAHRLAFGVYCTARKP